MTGWTQPGRLHHSRPRDCRAVRVFHPASDALCRLPAWCRRMKRGRRRKSHWKCRHDQPGLDASLSTNRPPLHVRSREGEEEPMARSGQLFRLSRSLPGPASQETCQSCRAKSPTQGVVPDASTEVVMADSEIFSPARLALGSADSRDLVMRVATNSSLIHVPKLRSGDVTGMQPAQVLGWGRLVKREEVIHRADARWLDSCDKHRNEGVADWGALSSTISSSFTETFPR